MRKKKTPTYFAFETPLSFQKLLTRLPEALLDFNANYDNPYSELRYEIPRGSQNRFRIGIERAGHSLGGYWYCATVEETDQGCRITGNIVFNPDEHDIGEEPKTTFREKIETALVLIFLLIPIILVWIVWEIYCLYRWVRHLPRELSKEKKLVYFMTTHLSCQLIEQH